MRVKRNVLAAAASVGLFACGDHSLDATSTAGSESTGATVGATDSSSSGVTVSMEGGTPDLPPPDAGFCPPGCDVELDTRWTFRGEFPDPQRRETVIHQLHAMTSVFDDTLMVAEGRGPDVWISRISRAGNLLWSERLPVSFPAQIRDLSAGPRGTIWYSGTAQLGFTGGIPVILYGQFSFTDIFDSENHWTQLQGIPEVLPRVGSIVPFNEQRAGLAIIDRLGFDGRSGTERIDVLDLNRSGAIDNIRFITSQSETNPHGDPVAAPVGENSAMAYPSFTGLQDQGYAVWIENAFLAVRDAVALPGAPDDIAATPTGRAVVVSHQWNGAQLEVFVDETALELPLQWEFRAVIDSTVEGRSEIVVDEDGTVIVAVPATRRVNGELRSRVEFIALTPDGQVYWNETLPLPFLPGERPISLELSADGLLQLGATVNDRVRVDQVEPLCVCE
ncbi:MAG: hypothetical protein AAF799_39835 [Myxococcota bacterium]